MLFIIILLFERILFLEWDIKLYFLLLLDEVKIELFVRVKKVVVVMENFSIDFIGLYNLKL